MGTATALRTRWRWATVWVVVLLFIAACGDATETTPETTAPSPVATGEPVPTTAPSTTASPAITVEPVTTTAPAATTLPATSTAPTTTTSVPEPPAMTVTIVTGGEVTESCVNGWTTPAPGTSLRTAALDLMRRDMSLTPDDLFIVDEMRYFVGPEDVATIAPRRGVERWYVKGYLESDPTLAGRWLVRRVVGNESIAGVGAVAPYDTTGYEPGAWFSFVGESDSASAYPGLPGAWWGVPEEPFAPSACTADNGPFGACSWGVGGCGVGTDVPACSGPPPEVMGCLAGT